MSAEGRRKPAADPHSPGSAQQDEQARAEHGAGFALDDRPIYDSYIAGRRSAALTVAVHVGLFDALDQGPLTLAELEQRLGFSARGTRSLMVALTAIGVVTPEGQGYALSPAAAAYLVRGLPGSLVGLIDLEMEHFLSPASLLDALRRDSSSTYGGVDPWEQHEQDPEAAARFTAAMHSVSERPAEGFAKVAALHSAQRVLDVGGGSGALCIALARAYPHLHCTVWDLPVVCKIAEEYAIQAGLAGQLNCIPGDMWGEPFPTDCDTVLLSQILHDWPHEKGRILLAKAFKCLPPGGRILIHEKLIDTDGGPLANALVNLDMMVWTEGQQYSAAELDELLVEAGFEEVICTPSTGYWSLVSARKP